MLFTKAEFMFRNFFFFHPLLQPPPPLVDILFLIVSSFSYSPPWLFSPLLWSSLEILIVTLIKKNYYTTRQVAFFPRCVIHPITDLESGEPGDDGHKCSRFPLSSTWMAHSRHVAPQSMHGRLECTGPRRLTSRSPARDEWNTRFYCRLFLCRAWEFGGLSGSTCWRTALRGRGGW